MPRIAPRVFLEALKLDSSLPYLLPACRSLNQSRAELKWIRNELPRHKHRDAVLRRSRHVPLQYILGSQPFGELDILCEPGVLIPRNDTEEWCIELIQVLKSLLAQRKDGRLRILDMCTGTGCIPLLLASQLDQCHLTGVDVSEKAFALASKNLHHNHFALRSRVDFALGDLFDPKSLPPANFELVISNPPYIPAHEFNIRNGMEKSVREYEPRLALEGDTETFDSLLANCVLRNESCNGFVFELAGLRQVKHVKSILPDTWHAGYRIDSNGHYRNVIGWKQGSSMKILSQLCTKRL